MNSRGMSNYIHKKVLRIPLKQILHLIGLSNRFELEEMLETKFKAYCFSESDNSRPGFKICVTDKAQYLDYVLFCEEDADCSSFCVASLLSSTERKKAKKIFSLIGAKCEAKNIHYIDYCYYDCGYPKDCYDVEDPRF